MDSALTHSELALSVKPGRYRHFKGGEYEVLGVSFHTEDPKQEFVVYKNIQTGQLWVRRLAMFTDQVNRDNYQGPRFIHIS